jgi:hypothetical protein
MSFRFTSAVSSDSHDRVRHHFQKLVTTRINHPLIAGRSFDTERLDPPHAVYVLRPEDLVGGKLLADSVEYWGYRYLVQSGGQPYIAAEVCKHPRYPGRHDIFLNIGPHVGGTAQALKQLAGRPLLATQAYEARLLRCIPLCFIAIWLKHQRSGRDLIWPLPTAAPPPFQAGQDYSEDELRRNFESILQQRQK